MLYYVAVFLQTFEDGTATVYGNYRDDNYVKATNALDTLIGGAMHTAKWLFTGKLGTEKELRLRSMVKHILQDIVKHLFSLLKAVNSPPGRG